MFLLAILGVADGTRTHDDQNHNLGLYQLSYSHRRALDSIIGWAWTTPHGRLPGAQSAQVPAADAAAAAALAAGLTSARWRFFRASV